MSLVEGASLDEGAMSRLISFFVVIAMILGVNAVWAAPVDPQIPFSTKVNVRVKRAYWFKWAYS